MISASERWVSRALDPKTITSLRVIRQRYDTAGSAFLVFSGVTGETPLEFFSGESLKAVAWNWGIVAMCNLT